MLDYDIPEGVALPTILAGVHREPPESGRFWAEQAPCPNQVEPCGVLNLLPAHAHSAPPSTQALAARVRRPQSRMSLVIAGLLVRVDCHPLRNGQSVAVESFARLPGKLGVL